MRRSQSTGDIDGRGSDDGAAEYIQYIDEGFSITSIHIHFDIQQSSIIFSIFFEDDNYDGIIRCSYIHNQSRATMKKKKKKHLQRLLLIFFNHLHHRSLIAALR